MTQAMKDRTRFARCVAQPAASALVLLPSSLISLAAALAVAAMLAACGSAPRQGSGIEERSGKVARAPGAGAAVKPMPPRTTRGGGYYLDDGPGDSPPPDIDSIPEPVPQLEPLHRGAMRPYVVLGQTFTPMTELQPYKAKGIASWYGRRYHGKQTSTGELYDMYGLSAAHPTLPLPSYVRVTNLATGKSVIVRVNDRGPFIDNRIIDLSYTAAHRLGVVGGGSALVEVETIIPDGSTAVATAPPRPRAVIASAPSGAASLPANVPAAPAQVAEPAADPILAIVEAARDVEVNPPAMRDSQLASAPRETPTDLTGVYLQLGAFGSRENAESYLAHAKAQFDWMAERLQVRVREGLYRVHAGPYASPMEAKLAAERIAAALGAKPVVVR
jgi:rare lipoprotein A